MALSQKNRMILVGIEQHEDDFVALSFSGSERISELFLFELELASVRGDIAFEDVAGKNVTVAIGSSDGRYRFFNGIITSFALHKKSEKDNINHYAASMRPDAWAFTQCVDCRIFQDKTIPDIIDEVLQPPPGKNVSSKINYRMELSGSYETNEIRIQYNETDMDFVQRLCEAEGIFHYFEHEDGKHTLVFADRPSIHKPCQQGKDAMVSFQGPLGGVAEQEVITALQPRNKLTSGHYTARDYNFTAPGDDMTVGKKSTSTMKSIGEIYEYPGGYEEPGEKGLALASVRVEAEDARKHALDGGGTCRGFICGGTFVLKGHPMEELNDNTYVLTMVQHDAKQHFSPGGEGDIYLNFFTCLPHAIPFRPLREHSRPVICSSQTAIVTGPEEEEIHTDEHGRVKVRFHWDRREDEDGDGNMSCWIRVSQGWAGSGWGAMHIPRVGQEVIVNFLDGDPDRPIVTGRVYHGDNLPPYDLPAEKTKSTIKSNSTKDGGGNFNEIRFEDLKGEEEFYTHAAKDRNEVVQNDMTTEVKNNQSVLVEQDRAVTVASGNEVIAIESGERAVSVKKDEKHENSGDFLHTVSGNYTLKVNGSITIDASGIVTINGAKIILNG